MNSLIPVLLPALLALPALYRLGQLRRLTRLGLVRPPAARWLLTGLGASVALGWAALAAVTRPAALWPPILGLAAAGIVLLAGYRARAGVHPGLYGLQRALPRDGLELIEASGLKAGPLGRRAFPRDLRPWLLLLPAVSLSLGLAWLLPEHHLRLGLLAGLTLAPLVLIPRGRLWLTPVLLLPPLALLLSQALQMSRALPAADWRAPLTLARCTGPVLPAPPGGTAWCLDVAGGIVYQFEMDSGRVRLRQSVSEAFRLFAVNADYAWVQQLPARGLVRVGLAGMEYVPVLSAHFGAADSQDRLWVLDVGQELWRHDPAGEAVRLSRRDGLLNNTAYAVAASPAGEVWVGSISGASWLPAGQSSWRRLERGPGLPGAVMHIAFGPQGEPWLLWQAQPGYAAPSDWGVSVLREGQLQRYDLGAQIGLEAPRLLNALAVDARGEIWFVTQSLPQRQRWLGRVTADGQIELHELGPFAAGGPYNYGSSGQWNVAAGVAADGRGGGLLYTSDGRPWLRWRP